MRSRLDVKDRLAAHIIALVLLVLVVGLAIPGSVASRPAVRSVPTSTDAISDIAPPPAAPAMPAAAKPAAPEPRPAPVESAAEAPKAADNEFIPMPPMSTTPAAPIAAQPELRAEPAKDMAKEVEAALPTLQPVTPVAPSSLRPPAATEQAAESSAEPDSPMPSDQIAPGAVSPVEPESPPPAPADSRPSEPEQPPQTQSGADAPKDDVDVPVKPMEEPLPETTPEPATPPSAPEPTPEPEPEAKPAEPEPISPHETVPVPPADPMRLKPDQDDPVRAVPPPSEPLPDEPPVAEMQPDESGGLVVAPGETGGDRTVAAATPLPNGSLEMLDDGVYWIRPQQDRDLGSELAAVPDARLLIVLSADGAPPPDAPPGLRLQTVDAGDNGLAADDAARFIHLVATGAKPVVVAQLPGAFGAAFYKGAYLTLVRNLPFPEVEMSLQAELEAAGDRKTEVLHRLRRLDANELGFAAESSRSIP